MTDAELAHTKELAFWMTERVFMNPISAKLLNEDWRKAFPDDVAVAERMKALVEALESAQRQNAQDVQIKARICRESNRLHDRLREAERRIAELEGQAIKFPPKVERDDSDGYWMLKGQRVSAANAAYYNEALKDVALALFAAGIKCEVKGE